jgi:chromosome segregation ATPase
VDNRAALDDSGRHVAGTGRRIATMLEKVVVEEGQEQLEQLEEKIQRAVDLIVSSRAEKDQLRSENIQIRQRLAEQEHNLRLLQEQLNRFEKERATLKARVQRILEQVDALTQAATDAG